MKVVLLLSVLLYVVLSFHGSEGKTVIRVKKPKILVSPQHIQSLERISDGVYANEYGYEDAVPPYALTKRTGRKTIIRKTSKGKKKIKVIKYGGVKNYATKYRTWAPLKEFISTKSPIFVEPPRSLKKRRRPFKDEIIIEDDFVPSATAKRRRRVKPVQRKPAPPTEHDNLYDEYDEDDYFPEEKRQEVDYDGLEGYRGQKKQKKRNQSQRKRKPTKPQPVQVVPESGYDEDHFAPEPVRYQPNNLGGGNGVHSYSNFVQHLPAPRPENEYTDYTEEDRYVRNERRKQKRRQKKPEGHQDDFRNRDQDDFRNRDQYEGRPENDDEFRPTRYPNDNNFDRYPATYTDDSYSPKKTRFNAQAPGPSPTPIYGDGHIEQSTRFRPNFARPISQPDYEESDYRAYRDTKSSYSPPDRYRPAPTVPAPDFGPTVYQERYPPNDQGFSRPYRDHASQQAQPNSYNPGVSYNPAPVVNPFLKNQEPVAKFPPAPNRFPSVTSSSSSFSGSSFSGSGSGSNNYQTITRPEQQDFPRFKDSMVYDNTETFYDFNNNANANSHNTKGIDTDFFARYQNGGSREYPQDKTDTDTDFMTKHQDLYNHGISGVPVQGDGYAKTKDYDIGYGEFQFESRSP